MNFSMKKSLLTRLLTVTILATLALVTVLLVYFGISERELLKKQTNVYVQSTKSNLANSVGFALKNANYELIQFAFDQTKSDKNFKYLAILDEDDEAIIEENLTGDTTSITVAKLLKHKGAEFGNYILAIEEANNEGEKFGKVILMYSLDNFENEFWSQISKMILLSLVIGIFILLVIIRIIKKVVKGIVNTISSAEKIAEGDFDFELVNNSEDEIGTLINAINKMKCNINNVVQEILTVAQDASNGILDTRANEGEFNGEYKAIMSNFNNAINAITEPLLFTADNIQKISNGDIPAIITKEYKGDFNEIKNNLNLLINSINTLINESVLLADNVEKGSLKYRADKEKVNGKFTSIIEGMNNSIDNLMVPYNYATTFLAQIKAGEENMITINQVMKGDYAEIKENIESVKNTLTDLLNTSNSVQENVSNGNLDFRVDVNNVEGVWQNIFTGYNEIMDAFVAPINLTAEYLERISKGDIPKQITAESKGDFNNIKDNVNLLITAIDLLVSDSIKLADAAVNGQLDERADDSKHQGDYKKIICGLNQTLDNVVKPLRLGSEYVEQIGNGIIPIKITDIYQGEYGKFTDSLNACITGLSALTDATNIMKIVSENDFTQRIDGKYVGLFSELTQAINEVIDRVVSIQEMTLDVSNGNFNRLGELKSIGQRCENDQLTPAFISMMENINSLVMEGKLLTKAALNGNLSTRADVNQFDGEYKQLISGMNDIMEAVSVPLTEAGQTLEKMANGNLTIRMDGNYDGDFAKLKGDINQLGSSLSDLINQVNDAVATTNHGASEISSTAETLAAAAQEQNSQADDVASAVEEMARTVTENAMGSTKTAEVAQENTNLAISGGQIVKDTVQKMNDIADVVQQSATNIEKLGEASQEIGEIIGVIDDISDQTNLLALNAAIEAARAGEHGRGFAVVADEVRKLAERTTGATKQIANMIKDIQKQTEIAVIEMNKGNNEVKAGIELSTKAGDSLENIQSSSNEVTDLITQIAAASEEQAATTEEISKNVLGISHASAESARQIELVAATASDLASTTTGLQQLMTKFQVAENNNLLGEGNIKYLNE